LTKISVRLGRCDSTSQFSGYRKTSRLACQIRNRFIQLHCSQVSSPVRSTVTFGCSRPISARSTKSLHRGIRLDNPGGDLARAHLDVDEEVVEQGVGVAEQQGTGPVALGEQIGL